MACDGFGLSILGYFMNTGEVDDVADVPSALQQHICPDYYRHYRQISYVVANMTDAQVTAKLMNLLEKEAIEDSEASTPLSQVKTRYSHRFLFGGIQCMGACAASTPATGAAAMRMQLERGGDGKSWIKAMTGASGGTWWCSWVHPRRRPP